MINIAVLYDQGHGVPQDFFEAAMWYRKAADAGDIRAIIKVAQLWENGHGVPKDAAQATIWYRKAALAGDEPSKKWLAEHSKEITCLLPVHLEAVGRSSIL